MHRTLALITTLAVASCAAPATRDAGDALFTDATDLALDSAPTDDTPLDVPVDHPPPPPRRVLPPSPRPLADLVGIASNPGDFPLGTSPASTARRAFYFRKIREMGIHRVRRDFLWSEIEPTQGTFAFTNQDQLVAEAQAAGTDILASLLYGNVWATTVPNADEYYPPDDPATFAHFAAQTATHFRGQLHDYEIWNEPNAGFRFWKPTLRGDAHAYGALLLDSARAIATADSTARVAFGGTVYLPLLITGGVEYATHSFETNPGLAASLTAYAFHAYTQYAPRAFPESDATGELPLLEKIARTAGMTDHEGVARSAPFWLTELGWPSDSDVTEAQQAQWTVRAVLLAAFGGVDGVYLYTLGDGPHPEAYPPEDAFGLVHYDADFADGIDPPDKPSFVAVRTLMQSVGSLHVDAREDVAGHPDDAFVIRLTDGTHRAWAVWSLESATASVTWTPPASTTTRSRVSLDGTRTPLGATEAITLGPSPVLVVE